ncbi:hypothetical protein PMZ80_005971 [Knufia obscura]|uniref:Protein kinase domain-containing protein n=1 Tax=Knufia obscura TaxID=1635080 RepID=A0ABR0RP59_9EURO|nr:hypothetical protein PMZ80_005971 [Knufia obscura]
MSHKHLRVYVIVFEDDDAEGEPLVYAEDLSRNGCHWNGSLMGKKSDAFLLSDGDRLRLTSQTSLVFQASIADERNRFDLIQEREMQTFCDKYVLTDRLLGSGAFGSVFMAVEQTSRTQLACKVVDLRHIGRTREQSQSHHEPRPPPTSRAKSELRQVRVWADKQKRQIPLEKKFNSYMREFEIISSISHANIIALDKVFITDNSIYIFQDLITAGDLFSYVESKNHNLLEVEAAVIIRQVLIAVQYLHERNIAHRDIKPENVMLTSLGTGARVVLTDFGSARHILPMQRATTFAGTEEYGAPEMMNQRSKFFSNSKKAPGYSLSIDMWSLGTISALLLAGFRAFDNPDGQHSSTLARKAELSRLEDDRRWRNLGERPKNFVRRLLVLEEDQRLTAKQALEHPWFTNQMHRTNFEELYQRTIKNWRPRIPNVPLVESIQGQCREVKWFESSQKVLEEQRPTRSHSLTPAEPPYKPFYRKVYDKTGLWPPKRKRGYGMSEEQERAVEQWNEAMSGSSSPSRAVHESLHDRFKQPGKLFSVPTNLSRKEMATSDGRLQLRACKRGSEDGQKDLDLPMARLSSETLQDTLQRETKSIIHPMSSFRSDLLCRGRLHFAMQHHEV